MEPVDLTVLHAAIKLDLETAFPDLETVTYYSRENRKVDTPALFFELEEIEANDPFDSGGEQWSVLLHFVAYVLVDYKADLAKLETRVRAANIAGWIKGRRFGAPIGPAIIKGVVPEPFHESDETMEIGWTHEAYISESIWTGGDPIGEVYASVSPEIGPPNIDSYKKLYPLLT